mmetsp:Transcript_59668/g.73069  ORF Transcript_59668/g.73069 Transcript_59668/m.73069 type:complete len:135 (-) Transcript_59668:116-520(-)
MTLKAVLFCLIYIIGYEFIDGGCPVVLCPEALDCGPNPCPGGTECCYNKITCESECLPIFLPAVNQEIHLLHKNQNLMETIQELPMMAHILIGLFIGICVTCITCIIYQRCKIPNKYETYTKASSSTETENISV